MRLGPGSARLVAAPSNWISSHRPRHETVCCRLSSPRQAPRSRADSHSAPPPLGAGRPETHSVPRHTPTSVTDTDRIDGWIGGPTSALTSFLTRFLSSYALHLGAIARDDGAGRPTEGGELQPTAEQHPEGGGRRPLSVELCVPALSVSRHGSSRPHAITFHIHNPITLFVPW